jgi:carboxyl-terminal PDZ ligand of neuronal nitric oxide synthase protein
MIDDLLLILIRYFLFCLIATQQNSDKSPTTPLSTSREIQLLREQLEQQSIQTRQALAQLMMVREQLISETNARIEAQVSANLARLAAPQIWNFLIRLQSRTQQLLQQNRELLEHIASLGSYNEPDRPGLNSASMGIAPQVIFTLDVFIL